MNCDNRPKDELIKDCNAAVAIYIYSLLLGQ